MGPGPPFAQGSRSWCYGPCATEKLLGPTQNRHHLRLPSLILGIRHPLPPGSGFEFQGLPISCEDDNHLPPQSQSYAFQEVSRFLRLLPGHGLRPHAHKHSLAFPVRSCHSSDLGVGPCDAGGSTPTSPKSHAGGGAGKTHSNTAPGL